MKLIKPMRLLTSIVIVIAILSHGSASFQDQRSADRPKRKEIKVLSQSTNMAGVTLTVECPDTLVSGGENLVTISLSNNGKEQVEFEPLAKDFRAPIFVVTRREMPVGRTAVGDPRLGGSPFLGKLIRTERLPAGQTIVAKVNLSRYYDLSVPDNYEIIAMWNGRISNKKIPIRLTTKPLKFHVTVKPGESVSVLSPHLTVK